MVKNPKLIVHLRLECEQDINKEISFSRLNRYLQEKLQDRFPLCDVEIGDIDGDWPGNDNVNYKKDPGGNVDKIK